MKKVRDVFVVGGARTPFAKSMTVYKDLNRKDLLVSSLRALKNQYSIVDAPVGDVALGALMNGSADWNLAREAVLDATLHPHTPAYNVQRACGTSLEAAIEIADKIALGQIDDGIAGGVDTNSDLPIEISRDLRNFLMDVEQKKTPLEKIQALTQFRLSFLKPSPPTVTEPKTGLSMGAHCELMVKEWGITREAQDELAYISHKNAVKGYERGFFKDLVFAEGEVTKDLLVRPDIALEKLAKLRPAFDKITGTLTAGNSSPLTDGAATVLLASNEAMQKKGWTPQARVVDAQSSAVDFVAGDGLLMAPAIAVGQLLIRNELTLQDFDFYEIHEAFAGQVLCTLKAWESESYCKLNLNSQAWGSIDRARLNVVGSSIAIGHPFAATGARILATAAKLLSESGERPSVKAGSPRRALISICTAGGMGVAMILESV